MAEAHLDRLLASLDAGFDAAIAREEDLAADDLALSLSQDRSLRDVVLRDGGWNLHLADGFRQTVAGTGRDFLLSAGDRVHLVPLAAAVVSAGDSAPPTALDIDLLGVLRRCVRSRTEVAVSTSAGLVAGRATTATPDHIAVVTPLAEYRVALGAVIYISLAAVSWQQGQLQ